MILRTISTALLLGAYSMYNFFWNMTATLYSAKAAGHQFDSSDISYVSSMTQIEFWKGMGLSTGLLFLLLLLVWRQPIKNLVMENKTNA